MTAQRIIAALLFIEVFLFVLSDAAFSHGTAAWIQADALHQESGWCCGVQDCKQFPEGAVHPLPGGYYLLPNGQRFNPIGVLEPEAGGGGNDGPDGHRARPRHAQTMLSIDNDYWGCGFWGDEDMPKPLFRCLFVPVGG